jgi:quercetin dioxygenase-like cupin family protein
MAENKPDGVPIRRIVTGHDSKNIAKVLTDGAPANVKYPAPGIVSTTLWTTFETPAEIKVGDSIEDMGNREVSLPPAANGSRFAVVDFLPGCAAFMHRTETIDYVIVLAGELDMDMDNSTVKVKAGDVLVQRGTNHAWINRGSVPARIAIVLIDGQSLGIGKAVPRPQSNQ